MVKINLIVIEVLLLISSYAPVQAASLGSTSEYCSNPSLNSKRFSLFESKWSKIEEKLQYVQDLVFSNRESVDTVVEFTAGALDVFNSDAYRYTNSHTYDSNAYGWDGDRDKRLRYKFMNAMIIREDAFQQVQLTNMNWMFDNNKLNQKEIKKATFDVFDNRSKKSVKFHVFAAPKCYSFDIYFKCGLTSQQMTSDRSFEYFVMSGNVDLKYEKCSGWHCSCNHSQLYSQCCDWGWVAKFS